MTGKTKEKKSRAVFSEIEVLKKLRAIVLLPFVVFLAFFFISCISSASKAEEYYSLGIAYFELEKYAEAENWFNKSKFHRVTRTASEYNLGRIAYETGRYKEAKTYFERIVLRDEENITALKAAAYTCIKLNDFEKAENYYRKILELVPESHDEGYNYALVLLALDKIEDAEAVLLYYYNTENPKALLVLARSQKQQGKPEAADAYSASLLKEDDPAVRSEYAAYLAEMGLTAKALEEYRRTLENTALSVTLKEEINKAIQELEGNGKSGAEAKE